LVTVTLLLKTSFGYSNFTTKNITASYWCWLTAEVRINNLLSRPTHVQHIYMCVCMYIYIYTYIYICMCIYIYVCVCVCVCVCVFFIQRKASNIFQCMCSIFIESYSYFLIYIQQDATLHSLFHLETALYVSGGTSTHHQERKQLYLQLPAAIAAGSSNGLTNTRCRRYSCLRSW